MLLDLPTAAKYNQWANARLYNALAHLTDADRKMDRGGFFRSIHETMNHILLVDLLYRGRLEGKGNIFSRLDAILHDDFADLAASHQESDKWLVDFHGRFEAGRLDEEFRFLPVGMDEGEVYDQSHRVCFINLFQHQIHHRGQVHHMISHAKKGPPPLDFIMFSRKAVDRWSNPDPA